MCENSDHNTSSDMKPSKEYETKVNKYQNSSEWYSVPRTLNTEYHLIYIYILIYIHRSHHIHIRKHFTYLGKYKHSHKLGIVFV